MSRPASVKPSARATAQPGCSAPSSKPPGGRPAPRHLPLAQYSRLARRRGANKATVAVAHTILDVSWHLLTTGALYDDPGARFFELRHGPAMEAKRLQRRIEALGFEVSIAQLP